MFNKIFFLMLVVLFSATSTALAENKTLKILFVFQQKMADDGNTLAMMKVGEMYEKGEGVKKSYDNALKMYNKAYRAGKVDALISINKLLKLKKQSKNTNKPIINNLKQEKKRAVAVRKKRLKTKRVKAKPIKVTPAARIITRSKKVKSKRSPAKTRLVKTKPKKTSAATAKINTVKYINEYEKEDDYDDEDDVVIETQNIGKPKDGFKSDPCKSKAARLLSICR